MKDFLTGRPIDPKERVLVVGDRVYSKESYIIFDTRKLEDYPPEVYYDKDERYLGKMYDPGIFTLPDIEEILIDYMDQTYSNHDTEDLREFLINKRIKFYEILGQDVVDK